MTTANLSRRTPSWRVFVTAWAILTALCAAWAISTPIAGVPDEPAHLIKAASVVRGEFVGAPGPNGQIVSVPQWVAFTHAQACFAFDGNSTADCAPAVPGDPADLVTASTTAGLYNPAYYLIVGWPSLVFSDSAGVFGMRVLGGIATSAFLAISVALLASFPRRRVALMASLVAITPMVLFLGGSVNPNGLETAATLASFVGVLRLVVQPHAASVRTVAVIVAISAAVAVNMRGLSPLWVLLALTVPLLLAPRAALASLVLRPAIRWMIVAIGVAGAAAMAWILGSGSLISGIGASDDPLRPAVPYEGASPIVGFYSVVQGTFELAQNMVGLFGWLDTPSPPGVFAVWSAFIASIIVVGFVVLRGRALLVASILVAEVVLVPAVVQAAYITGGGYIWQGRYTLPLFVCAIVGIGVLVGDALPEAEGRRSRRLVVVIASLWAVAQFFAFAMSVRRYSVGILDSWASMITSPVWSPPGGVLATLAVFALLVGVGALAMVRLIALPAVTSGSTQRSQTLSSPSGRGGGLAPRDGEVGQMDEKPGRRSDHEG